MATTLVVSARMIVSGKANAPGQIRCLLPVGMTLRNLPQVIILVWTMKLLAQISLWLVANAAVKERLGPPTSKLMIFLTSLHRHRVILQTPRLVMISHPFTASSSPSGPQK